MPSVLDQIKQLTRQLFPQGRAFKIPAGGDWEKLNTALAKSEQRACADAVSILNSAVADGPGFTGDDATDWERRLGIAGGSGVPLADRILAINQKLNYPGIAAPRQHYLYIQGELRAAGFDVYLHENIFPGSGLDGTKTIEQVLAPYSHTGQHGDGQMGDFQQGSALGVNMGYFHYVQHGDTQTGSIQIGQYEYYNKIANSLEEQRDAFFLPGSSLRSTFFIGGSQLGTFAAVPVARKNEFRQLVLMLKPAQTIAYLLIKYT